MSSVDLIGILWQNLGSKLSLKNNIALGEYDIIVQLFSKMRSSLVFQQTRPCPFGGEWKQKSLKLSCYVEAWTKNQNLSNELIDRWNSNKHYSWDCLQWQFAVFANKPYERQAAKSRRYWWKTIFQWEFVRIWSYSKCLIANSCVHFPTDATAQFLSKPTFPSFV